MKFFRLLLQKKQQITFALLVLFTALLLSKCALSHSTVNVDASFEAFTEELFRQELSSNTISLHYTLKNPDTYDIETVPVTYGEMNADPDAARTSIETYLTALETFSSVKLSAENQLTYDILHFYLETGEKGADYILYQEPLSPISGVHAQLPILLSEYQFHDMEDVEVYLKLLEETDEYFDSIISFEKVKAEAGIFMPDYQVDSTIDYCNSFVEMGDANYLYSSFEEKISKMDDLSSQEKTTLLEKNETQIKETIFPSYENLVHELTSLKGSGSNEMGLCYLPEGKEYYEYLVLQDVGVSEDIDTLQTMTQQQISEDLLAMENILFPTSTDLSVDENSVLSASPSTILEDLKSKSGTTFPEIPSVNTEIKYVSSDMEEFLSPAFYMIPAIDNTSENVIYINRGQTVDGLNLYTTLAHEGYPGHLYQTVYFSSQEPNPIRSILDFGGYVEGWATYAEMMSYYLAPLSTEEATLLQKNNSVILGLYAFADMGIHYDGWTLQNTIDFFSSYGISDEETVKEIYELIIGTPANYLKYYLGYVKFYTLKKEVADVLGEDFSQLEFHKAVLDVGPAPFDIVESYVRETLY